MNNVDATKLLRESEAKIGAKNFLVRDAIEMIKANIRDGRDLNSDTANCVIAILSVSLRI